MEEEVIMAVKTKGVKKTAAAKVQAEAVKVEAVKEEVKTAEVKPAETVKAAPKKTAAKKTVSPKEVTEEILLQFAGKEISMAEISDKVKACWTNDMGKDAKDIADLKIYVKPEENAAYFVINNDTECSGKIDL